MREVASAAGGKQFRPREPQERGEMAENDADGSDQIGLRPLILDEATEGTTGSSLAPQASDRKRTSRRRNRCAESIENVRRDNGGDERRDRRHGHGLRRRQPAGQLRSSGSGRLNSANDRPPRSDAYGAIPRPCARAMASRSVASVASLPVNRPSGYFA